MLLVTTTIDEFVKYVNRWNTGELYASDLKLEFHGLRNGGAAWSAGNVLIKSHQVAPSRVLCEFDNFDSRGSDNVAKRAHNRLTELIQASFPVDDTPGTSRIYGLMSRQAERVLRAFPALLVDNPLDVESEAEFRARNPDFTEEELDKGWQDFCRAVEQERTKRRDQERRRKMTAAEAADEFFASLGDGPKETELKLTESDAGDKTVSENIISTENYPNDVKHFRELMARLQWRNREGWKANNDERIKWDDVSPEKREAIGVRDTGVTDFMGVSTRVVYRTVEHPTRGEWRVWINLPDGRRDWRRLAYIIASERHDGQSEIDFIDGVYNKGPIGSSFAEFARWVVSEWSADTTPAADAGHSFPELFGCGTWTATIRLLEEKLDNFERQHRQMEFGAQRFCFSIAEVTTRLEQPDKRYWQIGQIGYDESAIAEDMIDHPYGARPKMGWPEGAIVAYGNPGDKEWWVEFRHNNAYMDATQSYLKRVLNMLVGVRLELNRAPVDDGVGEYAPMATGDSVDEEPWNKIPEHSWDRIALEQWWMGRTVPEIASKLPVESKTVRNRLSELRQTYGTDIVPTDEQRKRL